MGRLSKSITSTDTVNLLTSPMQHSMEAIARTVKSARLAARMSLDGLAAKSGVSKGTLVALESARANPSLGVLCHLAGALGISMADLFADIRPSPEPQPFALDQGRTAWKGPKGGSARLVAGTAGPEMVEFWEWELRPGEKRTSAAHLEGTHELILVHAGSLGLSLGAWTGVTPAGHGILLRTDQDHAYWCEGKRPVRFQVFAAEWPISMRHSRRQKR